MPWMIAIVLVIAGIAAMAVRLDRVWSVFGPADLGPVAFETLQRGASPNDALACPPGLCVAERDIAPPIYSIGTEGLRQAMARVIASEPDVTQVDSDALAARYVQRSKWMRFPDTVVVRYIPLGDGRSTLALYSRSQLGRGDFGVNKARIARWLDKLARDVPMAP